MTQVSDDLVSSAVAVIVQHGFLVQVNITLQEEDNERSKTLMLAPNTTVPDLKRLLAKEWSIPEEDQRLYQLHLQNESNNNNVDDNKPLVGGTLVEHGCHQVAMNIFLQRHALDPRLKSLFGMVGFEQWEERERVMNLMTKKRIARHCYNQHALIELDNYGPASRQASYLCAKCHLDFVGTTTVNGEPKVCNQCRFCLCTLCFESDTGSTRDHWDPYQALEALALDLGLSMALMSVYYGDREFMFGPFRDEYASQIFIDGKGRTIKPNDKVLHNGIRLKIVFGPTTRLFLIENGYYEMIREAETDVLVREQGATAVDMMGLLRGWIGRGGTSEELLEDWSNRFPRRARARPYATARLISYNLEEAVYEVGICDYY